MAVFYPSIEEIYSLRNKPELGELTLLNFLKDNLDDSFEVFFNPFLNGDRPDIIIMKENQGVLIIEVKDYILEKYTLDSKRNWKVKHSNQIIKSPISQVFQYKENLFNLHIENLLAKKISDIRNFNTVNCGVYFHNATNNQINDFLIKPFKNQTYNRHSSADLEREIKNNKYLQFLKYNIRLIGRDDLTESSFNNLLKSCFLISSAQSIYFTEDIYKSFKRFLNPPYHFKEQANNEIPYTAKQLEIINGGVLKKEQRIKGVVGSGKTTVLAARAVQAVKRTGEEVLILTYNITLKNYIKDKISKVREDFSWKDFIIQNYHSFINTELNNIGVEIVIPSDFDTFSHQEKENYFEENYYSNIDLFKENADQIKKYNAIFIDEIQDYKRPWMDIIKNYFLKENGEYVLFGDVKQNIYNNKILNKDISTNVRGINELKNSFRSEYKIQELTIEFQKIFFADKYEIDDKNEFTNVMQFEFPKENNGVLNYMYLSNTDNVVSLYTIIHQNAINKGFQPNDITILGNTISLLKKFDSYYRYRSNEKTNTMFETSEMIYKIGLSLENNAKLKWLDELKILFKDIYRRNSEKLNSIISILLTLNDLFLEYPEQFKEKLEMKCKSFEIVYTKFIVFYKIYKTDIENFKVKYNSATLKSNLKLIRDNKKLNFYMNSGTIKISTIHSFKGWESENLFLIIEKNSTVNFDEILYTGITRGRSNLIIINYGNSEYNEKLNQLIKKVAFDSNQ